jgi:hypothetical protein
MTVLNYSEVLNFSRPDIWRRITGFSKELPRYLHWIEKAEWLAGNPQGLGGRWSFQTRTSAGLWPLDLEITEWQEGERIALMPFGISGILKDIQLFQILVELEDKPNDHTQIKVLFEYEPISKLGRLKNLTFQRRHFLDCIALAVEALSRMAVAEVWVNGITDKKH